MSSNIPLGNTDKLMDALVHLANVIDERVFDDPNKSYTAHLLNAGVDQIIEKWNEESSEFADAVYSKDTNDIAHEAADVLYHLMVALRSSNVELDLIATKLQGRQSQSGFEEKQNRPE